MFQLSQDNDYWTQCDSRRRPEPDRVEPGQPAVGQERAPTGPIRGAGARCPTASRSTRSSCCRRRASSASRARPPTRAMLNGASGTFRIRATGRAGKVTRTVVTTLRRRSFLDYIYFTDYETRDPAQYPDAADAAWAAQNCAKTAREPPGRLRARSSSSTTTRSTGRSTRTTTSSPAARRRSAAPRTTWSSRGNGWVRGLGRARAHRTSESGRTCRPPTRSRCRRRTPASPPSPTPAYTYTGKTDDQAQRRDAWTSRTQRTTTRDRPVPAERRHLRRTTAPAPARRRRCCSATTTPVGCAVVYLSGTYSRSLTIGSRERHRGHRRRAQGRELGRRARADRQQQRARRTTRSPARTERPDSCTNATGTLQNVTIEAAILALTHSFIVDNYRCGAGLGKLNGQRRDRAEVPRPGRHHATAPHRLHQELQLRRPAAATASRPYFLDPVQASWKVNRINEQVPAIR